MGRISVALLLAASVLLFIGCESESPTDESGLLCEHPGTAGPGVWVVESTTENYPTYLVKYNFDGSLNYRSAAMHCGGHMDINHQDGTVWLEETPQGETYNHSIVKHSQTGEVLGVLESSEVGFSISPLDLRLNYTDGCCWYAQMGAYNGEYGDVDNCLVKVDSNCALAFTRKDFDDYRFVAPSPFDNSCWVTADNLDAPIHIAKYSQNGDLLLQFPIAEGELDHLCPMVSDPRDGSLWIIVEHKLCKYSTDGELLLQSNIGEQALGMAVNPYSGDLCVLAADYASLFYFNPQGVMLWQISTDGSDNIDIAKSDQILVSKRFDRTIEEYSPQGVLLGTYPVNAAQPMDICVWK